MRAVAIALIAATVQAANWPAWRGVDASGHSPDKAPAHWSKTENVRWRTPLPEPGNSTPVVWGNRIFVTQALKKDGRRTVMCFDRASGKLLWQSGVDYSDPEPTHQTNPYASASPVTDGKIVIAWFGSAGMVAYDFNGNQVWRRDLGQQKHTWGYGSSPVIHGDRVYLNFGPGARAFLIALDKNSGKTLWQVDLPPGQGSKFANWSAEDMYGSWSTPLVIKTSAAGDREELIASLPQRVIALDPGTGKTLWKCDGMGDLVYPSPVFADGIVVAMGGFGGPSLAVKAGGSGDVTATHRLWRRDRSRQMIGSGVMHQGRLYTVDNAGIMEALDPKTGASIFTGRLASSGGSGAVWSSPVLSDQKLYVMNQSGTTFVLKAGPEFEILATNQLDEQANSSVVISDGEVVLRTHSALWLIGGPR
jgi:outer membrane protein assembly factor BamB